MASKKVVFSWEIARPQPLCVVLAIARKWIYSGGNEMAQKSKPGKDTATDKQTG